MSQLEVPEEITHLDFEPEKKNDYYHHKHPTMSGYRWCGTPMEDRKTFMDGNGKKSNVNEITCPRCLALIDAFGMPWYWQTHRKHYGSNCTVRNGVIYHDCGV